MIHVRVERSVIHVINVHEETDALNVEIKVIQMKSVKTNVKIKKNAEAKTEHDQCRAKVEKRSHCGDRHNKRS